MLKSRRFLIFERTWCSSDRSDIPSELIPYCRSVLAAQTGFCGQDAKKQGNIKQRRREQTLKNTCWPNTEAPYAQLYPDCWLTAGWPACMPTLSQAWTHTYTHTNADRHTLMQHTLHWGQASKSNPGLLFCPERTAAPSTHYHYWGGKGGAGGVDEEWDEMEGKLGRGWRKMEGAVRNWKEWWKGKGWPRREDCSLNLSSGGAIKEDEIMTERRRKGGMWEGRKSSCTVWHKEGKMRKRDRRNETNRILIETSATVETPAKREEGGQCWLLFSK